MIGLSGANVIISMYQQRDTPVQNTRVCIPDAEVGGKIDYIEDIKVRTTVVQYWLTGTAYHLNMEYELVLIVMVNDEFEVVRIYDWYERTISLREFNPPITAWPTEGLNPQISINNWQVAAEVTGFCEDLTNPCFLTSPVSGTCLSLDVTADLYCFVTRISDVDVEGIPEPD